MKKYTFHLRGTGMDKCLFAVVFSIASLSVLFLPLAILMLIHTIEIREQSAG